MFTAIIMSFNGDIDSENRVGYGVEWWMFKPKELGKQVNMNRIVMLE